MLKKLFLTLAIISSAYAGQSDELAKLGQDYIDCKSRFSPVWATGMGIFDYDSLLTDYSSESIFDYRNKISIVMQKLRQMKTKKLNPDDYIDYQLLVSNIKYDEFILAKFPIHEHSPALYLEDALNSLYYILLDNSRTIEEKAPFLLARMRAIPEFLEQKWVYQSYMDKIFYEIAIDIAADGPKLIEETAQLLYEAIPDSARRIARYKTGAAAAIKNYGIFCKVEIKEANESHFIGKDQLDYLLKNIYFLDINSDSLITLGWHWYNKADAAMDSIQKVINSKQPDIINIKPDPSPLTKEDILQYYQREIDQTADFLRQHDIVTIPDDIGRCIPVEMPGFMLAAHRGIAYQSPPPFSSDQTGHFYVRPIPALDSATTTQYKNMIQNHGFKGSVVHEAYPGHHLQLSLANRHPSSIRRIQGNTMMAEGWALYCEQMATEQGLFDDDDLDQRWLSVYGGIRYRAARIIIDCSLADSSMTPDSALVFMNNMLGENTYYFKAEIRRYCAHPTQALSYLTGKLLILEMLEKTRKKEGKSFSLKRFHDSMLAEGTIPLPLIVEKLGYKK